MLHTHIGRALHEDAPTPEQRQQRYFHGTPSDAKGQAILREGIRYMEAPRGKARTGRAMLDPLRGRVYLTPHLAYAQIYAIGGDYAGTDHLKPGEENRYGWLFEVDPHDLVDIVPDEDHVGEVIYIAHRPEPSQYDSEFARAMKADPQFLRIAAKSIGAFATERQLQRARDGEYAYFAAIGKKALPRISAALRQALVDKGAHVAHQGAMSPLHAWKIDKMRVRELRRDGSNFFEVAVKVK